MSTKYYYGSAVYGEIYDWNKIFKLYDSLKIPDTCWKVKREALKSKYAVEISERSIGKTTNVLLLGLCQRALYNTQICYVRGTEDEFKPSDAKKLTEIIRSYDGGRYVKQLTHDKYNTIVYKAKAFYYAYMNEEGEIEKKDPEECIKVLTVDRNIDYKSTLNMPKGDFFVYDEFVRKHYAPDEFVDWCDLFKTVARDRLSPVIFMLANSISTVCPYYGEMEIRKEIRTLKAGDSMSLTTEGGTKIFLERCTLPTKAKEKRSFFNSMFLGFKNEKLGAITGGQLWALPKVPHLYRREEGDEPLYLYRNLYIKHEGELLRVDIVLDSAEGLHLEVVPGRNAKEDSVILTSSVPEAKNEVFALGGRQSRIRKVLMQCINGCKVFYSTNDEGAIFRSFIERSILLEKNPLNY